MSDYRPIQSEMRHMGGLLAASWRRLGRGIANLRRTLLRSKLPDYVVFVLDGEIGERNPDEPLWYSLIPGRRPPLTIEALHNALERVAGDPAVQGVLFLVRTPEISLAQAQSIAGLFACFRTWSTQYGSSAKKVIVHLEQTSAASYVLACAADSIFLTPLTEWSVLGLHIEPVYLQETLARAGIEFEVAKIAPWKTAYDRLSRTTMSAEERDQYNWLLDSLFGHIITGISQGRKLPCERVKSLIDQAPLTASCALEADLIDGILYEDELADFLGHPHRRALLAPYAKIKGLLMRHIRPRHAKAVGVLSLEGTIMPGRSRSFPVPLPLLGDHTLGSTTVQQQVRAARSDENLAAVIVHVDSPGGSALASDLMWRELQLLATEKPLVVYMGNVAASGGYYIATPGHKIIAQPATMTGSIGVISGKPVTQETVALLSARRYTIQRGDNATIYSDAAPWTPNQREKVEESIHHMYREFKGRVADGRNLEYEGLDAICLGRVWTGAQAKAHGLVDELGDFQLALTTACRLADLPTDGSVRTVAISAPKERQMAQPLAMADEAASLRSWQELGKLAVAALRGDWSLLLGGEHLWLLADGLPEVKT